MSIWNILGDLIKPATDLIDELHTSEDEKNQVKAALFNIQSQAANEILNYEKELFKAKADVIKAEAQGNSWLQRTWRPITMLTFLVLVVLDTMGLTAFRLSGEAWTLLQIGLCGYVVGRSAEKVAPKITEVFKK